MPVELPLLIVAAYLLGSVSFAVLFSRLGHLPDPRNTGSGNPGASNMLRLGNRPLAFATLLCDIGKGALAVWLAARCELGLFSQGLVGLAAVTGHILPLYHQFRGGKGVATAAGAIPSAAVAAPPSIRPPAMAACRALGRRSPRLPSGAQPYTLMK